jgi:hypothetical protein
MNHLELEDALHEFYSPETEQIDVRALEHALGLDVPHHATPAFRSLARQLVDAATMHNAVVAGERPHTRRARWLWLVDVVLVFAPMLALMA